MPGLVRKLLIFAAVDGLILQPAPPRNHPPSTQQAIKIDYNGNVAPLLKDRREEDTAPNSVEAHGIVGLFKVASNVFLISICGRELVAQIRGRSVYKITDVALIPLSSQSDADKAITATKEHLQRQKNSLVLGEEGEEIESEDESPSVTADSLDEEVVTTPPKDDVRDPITGQRGPGERRTSVAEDVIGRKGVYGRFANKWFSKKGWTDERRRMQGMSSKEDLTKKHLETNVESTLPKEEEEPTSPMNPDALPLPDAAKEGDVEPAVSPEEIPKALGGQKNSNAVALLPKIIRTTKLYFSSGNFYFSYDHDLSRGVGAQKFGSSLPLFKQYDPLFFWNEHIMSPLIDAGQHSFVLPIIQGFVGQRQFSIKVTDENSNSAVIDSAATPNDIQLQNMANDTDTEQQPKDESSSKEDSGTHDFLLTIISRRSTMRAGLRYLRRGVDEDGNTANSVETEQILSSPTWDTSNDKIHSFTQFRGSIPLYFSQSPYSLKPQVNTWGSPETNMKAFKLHFSKLAARYGSVYCDSLVDKHGTEAKIGEAYEKAAQQLNAEGGMDGKGTSLGFEWFDFHHICRGMHFENVSVLMDSMGPFMKSTGWTVIENDQVVQKQSGVIRTNCMDCLDRTNVVQSACARTALEAQLGAQSFSIDLQNDPSTSWFNNLWADNGDAISRQYAGTAALKGDFTRTRKRNIAGALTDFGLTLSRYYNNIVNDYFAQAMIDYLLGRATDSIFAEFEADMKNSDYFVDLRKVRQAAIERAAGIVIENEEESLLAGWTLSVPSSANSLKTATFEEAVLLLTEKAFYFCRLDWGTEKVREFERVALENVEGIVRGVYITSTLAQRHMDADKNVGFVIRYRTVEDVEQLVRKNTRSLDAGVDQSKKATKGKQDAGRFLAFKALPPRTTVTASDTTEEPLGEVDLVKNICEEVVRVANKAKRPEGEEGRTLDVEEKDIISLADAKKSTGYLEQFGYSLKKLVWA